MSAFTASAVASPGAAKVLASRRSVASRAPMMAARAPVAKFGARAPLSVSAKAGPSGEIKKVRARVIHDAHVDLSFERGWTRFHPRRGRPSTDEPSKPCSPHFIIFVRPPLHCTVPMSRALTSRSTRHPRHPRRSCSRTPAAWTPPSSSSGSKTPTAAR